VRHLRQPHFPSKNSQKTVPYPRCLTFSTGGSIEFIYDAAGTKLRKTVKQGTTIQYVQDYLPGGIEYRQNGTGLKYLEAVYHSEGRYYNTNVGSSNFKFHNSKKQVEQQQQIALMFNFMF
jgi:hypothetical protein